MEVEAGFTEAGRTSLPAAHVSTAAIIALDIMVGAVDTVPGMAPVGATRITDTDRDLALALVGPIGQATLIRTDIVLGGGHPSTTLTMFLHTRTLTTDAMNRSHQIPVPTPTIILDTIILELPWKALQAATP